MATEKEQPAKRESGWPPNPRDTVQSVLALGVTAYAGLVLWGPLTSGSSDEWRAAQAVGAIVLPFLGTIVGYYFGGTNGAQIAQEAVRQARQALQSETTVKTLSNQEMDQVRADLAEAREAGQLALEEMRRLQEENEALHAMAQSDQESGNDGSEQAIEPEP